MWNQENRLLDQKENDKRAFTVKLAIIKTWLEYKLISLAYVQVIKWICLINDCQFKLIQPVFNVWIFINAVSLWIIYTIVGLPRQNLVTSLVKKYMVIILYTKIVDQSIQKKLFEKQYKTKLHFSLTELSINKNVIYKVARK